MGMQTSVLEKEMCMCHLVLAAGGGVQNLNLQRALIGLADAQPVHRQLHRAHTPLLLWSACCSGRQAGMHSG